LAYIFIIGDKEMKNEKRKVSLITIIILFILAILSAYLYLDVLGF